MDIFWKNMFFAIFQALALPCDPVPMSLTSAQLIQYVVVRGDLIRMLSWPTGAVIAQACHASTAVLWMHRNDPNTIEYTRELDHMHKVVLEVRKNFKGVVLCYCFVTLKGAGC